jgi:hypothetical protein
MNGIRRRKKGASSDVFSAGQNCSGRHLACRRGRHPAARKNGRTGKDLCEFQGGLVVVRFFPPGRMVLAHGHQAGKMPATTLERAGTLRAGHFASGLSLGEVTGTVSVVFMLYHW